ncbi:MAG: hypothetical protein K2R98_10180 [Gemmataceae bacterium]|nr:hypothetical protein [Gemmataceae bacterium]
MSEGQSNRYKLDHTVAAKEQIQSIAVFAAQAGKLPAFLAILKKAVLLMQMDPRGWGDPEYRSPIVEGVFCHGILRPVAFRYVVYEQVRGVVLLNVQVYADFA